MSAVARPARNNRSTPSLNKVTKFILAFVLTTIISALPGAAFSDGKKSVTINVIPHSTSETDNLSATAFGLSLAAWVSSNEKVDLLPIGVYTPTFQGLVAALSSQIQIWRELKQKQDPRSTYMNHLILVDDHHFLKEYVWTHHAADCRGNKPAGLKLSEYQIWEKANLQGHVPRIEARLNIK